MEDDSAKRKATIPSDEEPPDKKARRNESVETIYSQSKNILDNWGSEESSKICVHNDRDSSQSQNVHNIANDDNNPAEHENTASHPAANESADDIPVVADENSTIVGQAVALDSTKKMHSPEGNCGTSSRKEISNDNRDETGKKIKWDCARHFSDQNDQANDGKRSEMARENTSGDGENNPTAETIIVSSDEPPRNKCAYGTRCYRRNSEHRRRFSHPGDEDYDLPDPRPECPYGVKCYRKNPQHKRDFKHTNLRRSRAQTPIRGGRRGSDAASGTEQSSADESVDESDYEPSCYGGTSDEYRSDLDAFSDFEGTTDCDDDK